MLFLQRLSLALLLFALSGCAVAPRLPMDASRAVNRDDMRVLSTQNVDLYYPAPFANEARLLAERAEGCAAVLRERLGSRGGIAGRRIELIFPDLPYNNAFVQPPLNGDFFSLVPTFWNVDFLLETGMPPDPGHVACHELTHYVHAEQTFRSFGFFDRVLGYLWTPQVGLDAWFWEGLATYEETALQPQRGRPAWPAWEGLFHAAVAGRRLSGGDLSELNRKIHWGNQYLYGSHFIDFLVRRYGEPRLRQLLARQGGSFFFPLFVNTRFKRVYGRSLSRLIDEFGAELAQRYPRLERPASQRTIRDVGMNGRFARAADGSEALIEQAMDVPPTLTVYGPDGHVRQQRRLTDALPRRDLVSPSSVGISGLSFSRDGSKLYFVAGDLGPIFERARLLELDVVHGKLRLVASDLSGIGGEVSPDGTHYLFVRTSGHGNVLATYALATGEVRELYRAPAGVYLASPRYSLDGARIVASTFDQGFVLALFDAQTGERVRTLSVAGAPLWDASFVDADRLLFLGSHAGRFQAFVYTLSTRQTTRVTSAPYLAMHPRASGQTVRFFNREGFRYTLDEVALPSAPTETPPHAPVELAVVDDAPTPLPPAATAPLSEVSDESYSVFPRVLIPSIRVPQLGLGSAGALGVGGYLGGTDALGKHRWGVSANLQLVSWLWSGGIGYLNTQLSPLWLQISATQLAYADLDQVDDERGDRIVARDPRRQRDLTISALLALRTTQLTLSLHATEDKRREAPDPRARDRTLGGGTLGLYHSALESTAMSGPRRGYVALASASYYPDTLNTLPGDLTDLRGELWLVTPLPFSRRHTLSLGLSARALIDSEVPRLLEVGGTQLGTLYDHPSARDRDEYPGLPAGRRFREPLRGFETAPFSVDRIGIADLTYRYPLIIDRGTATSLYLLPSFFLRQIDFELFATGASDRAARVGKVGHLAAGGAVSAHWSFWRVPLVLRYQLAQRVSDDRDLQHLVGLGTAL